MANLIERPDVFGSTVFCDDTRIELSGKLIHIGVYQGVMVIQVPFPATLPTFSFAISIAQRVNIFNPKITYRIFLPGDPDDASSDEASIVVETNETAPGQMNKHADTVADAFGVPEEERKFVLSSSNMGFTTLQIKQPGQIKVRADIGDKRYQLGSLLVVPAPPKT
jgi:hypothetical protein